MPSLVLDARMLRASGIGVYLQQLIPRLSKDFELTLLGDADELATYHASASARIIPMQAPIYSLQEQLELRLRIPACDLFWSPHYNVPLLPIAARHRVVTIHDVYHLAYQHTLTLPQKMYANLLIRAAVRMSDRVLTVSEFSKQEIIKYTKVRPETVVAIPNGVDSFRFVRSHSAHSPSTQEAAQPIPYTANPYLLFVGNVKPHKNLVTLLKAFVSLQEHIPKLDLLIVGKKEGFITGDTQVGTLLENDALLKKRVIFTGFVEDELLPHLYQQAAALVFPSVYEGFGLPPLEAMASGCPVVAADTASIPEVCGDAALYFSPLNHLELAERLSEVLNVQALRDKLIANGYRRVQNFSWDKTADGHLAVFRQILEGGDA
ncbi:glycosyltransferase family 1 protein [uncultured Pontibacter sp.]|uniref:glycosyltransferase family 4 protein n=1 Tax=uncultured Pontibacter sp. TaxID=453356 RepID=UPI00260634EC|nr:glycosyltransferase family 1 protein [uncultured Pontibacter sp.]